MDLSSSRQFNWLENSLFLIDRIGKYEKNLSLFFCTFFLCPCIIYFFFLVSLKALFSLTPIPQEKSPHHISFHSCQHYAVRYKININLLVVFQFEFVAYMIADDDYWWYWLTLTPRFTYITLCKSYIKTGHAYNTSYPTYVRDSTL